MLKTILLSIAVVIGLFLLIQLVPDGRQHNNPAVVQEPNWDSSQTRDLASRACFDCHSNETVWPWYSNVAPISWLIQHDVEEGRQRLNFSQWGTRRFETHEISEVVGRGAMPPLYYVLLHPNAGLTQTEKQVLINGLNSSLVSAGAQASK